MIIRVPQIYPRDVISAGWTQGCQREREYEQHLGLATNSPRAGLFLPDVCISIRLAGTEGPWVGTQPITELTAQLPKV